MARSTGAVAAGGLGRARRCWLLVVVGAARRWPRRWFLVAGAAAGVAHLRGLPALPAARRAAVQPVHADARRRRCGARSCGWPTRRACRSTRCWSPTRPGGRRRSTPTSPGSAAPAGSSSTTPCSPSSTPTRSGRSSPTSSGTPAHQDVLLGTGLGALGVLAGVAGAGAAARRGPAPAARGQACGGPGDPRVVPLVLALAAARHVPRRPGAERREPGGRGARRPCLASRSPRTARSFERLQRELAPALAGRPHAAAVQLPVVRQPPHGVQRLGIAAALLPDGAARRAGGAGGDAGRSSSPTTSRPAAAASRPSCAPGATAAARRGRRPHRADARRRGRTTGRCPSRSSATRRGMLLPTPAVARRVAATLRADGCDGCVFGASAPLGLLAPRLRAAGAGRAGRADPRARGVVGGGAGHPAAAAPDRRRRRRR